MRENNHCVDCGKLIGHTSVRCRFHANKIRSGENNSCYGKTLSSETKGKMSESKKGGKNPNWKGGKIKRICEICGKEFYVEPYRIKNGGGKFCSNKCKGQSAEFRRKVSEAQKGEKNHRYGKANSDEQKEIARLFMIEENKKRWSNPEYRKKVSGENSWGWRGGISKLPYGFDFTKELKQKIKERDNYECQNCGMTEEEHIIVLGYGLVIHHIDYDKKNNQEENHITLCSQCNSRANYRRRYWQQFYVKKIKEKNASAI